MEKLKIKIMSNIKKVTLIFSNLQKLISAKQDNGLGEKYLRD